MRVDPLLKDYPIRIREVTIGVILSISFTFYIFPKFLDESEKIEHNIINEIETFDIPQTEQIKIPEPPARPSVPIASEDDFFDEDITIEDTNFDDFEDWDSAPPLSGGPKVTFVAFDKAPKAKIAIRPIYPDMAQEAGIEGTVYIQFFINNDIYLTSACINGVILFLQKSSYYKQIKALSDNSTHTSYLLNMLSICQAYKICPKLIEYTQEKIKKNNFKSTMNDDFKKFTGLLKYM